MFLPDVQVHVQYLYPARLVVDIEHPGGAAHHLTAVDCDPQVGTEHDQSLERVRVDDRLDPSDAGVENTHSEDDGTCDLDVVVNSVEEARHLDQSQSGGVDDDCHVEDHLQTEEGGDDKLDSSAVPELQILVAGRQFQSVVDRNEEVNDDDHHYGEGQGCRHPQRTSGVDLGRGPQQGDGRHEARRQGQRHRD